MLTAGLIYLGAGLGLLLFEVTGRPWLNSGTGEAPVRQGDAALLGGVILTGGMLGPLLMLWGLGVLVILIGAGILMYRPGAIREDIVGILAVVGACLCWAIDNNLSQRLSLRDPLVVTRIKTLGAGPRDARPCGAHQPAVAIVHDSSGDLSAGTCQLWGKFGAGHAHAPAAQRGAAREAGFFATAPFIGAVVAVPVLGEGWDIQDAAATTLMMAGVALLLRGRHTHAYQHEKVEHDHSHRHEEHHDHVHNGGPALHEAHAHVHWHLPLTHDYPHLSELHHRHDH